MRYIKLALAAILLTPLLFSSYVAADETQLPTLTCPSGDQLGYNGKYRYCTPVYGHGATKPDKVTCPTGFDVKKQHKGGGVHDNWYYCEKIATATRICKPNEALEAGTCVDKAKRRSQTNTEIIPKIPKPVLETIYRNHHKAKCAKDAGGGGGDAACIRASFDEFLATYFADTAYTCGMRVKNAWDEYGAQGGGGEPKNVMATCLAEQYGGLDKGWLIDNFKRTDTKDKDFVDAAKKADAGTSRSPDPVVKEEDKKEGAAESSGDACSENLSGVGWLICPMLSTIAKATDGALEILQHFLTIEPKILDTSSPTYEAWTYFRNIANSLFVVVFLVVIFSQVTSVGINNYSIKKLLPRLVVGAILVNLSFYISQIVVDISNILGYSLESMLEGAMKAIGAGSGAEIVNWQNGLWQLFAGLTGAAIIVSAILLGGSVLLASLLAVAVAMIIIIARQAVVVLLIVVSPIAFVAWLLPNTESLFKKWVSLLRSMLVLFPLVALLYGGGKLASHILMQVATSDPANTNKFLQIAGLAVAFLPLGATPFALRSSMNALGSVGGMINKLSTKANARVGSKIKNDSRMGEAWKNHKFKSAQRQANRRAGNGWLARQGRELTASGRNKFVKGLGRAMSLKGDMTRAIDKSWAGGLIGGVAGAAAANTRVNELFEQEVKASGTLLQGKTMSEIKKIASDKKSSTVMRTAALDMVMSQGGFKDRNEALSIVASDSSLNGSIKSRVIQAAYAKGDGTVYGNDFGDNILTGTIKDASGLEEAAFTNAVKGNLQPEHLVQGAAQTEYIVDVISDRLKAGDPSAATARLQFRSAAARARSNANTSSKLSAGGAIDRQISRL